jgi:hypothetical protein
MYFASKKDVLLGIIVWGAVAASSIPFFVDGNPTVLFITAIIGVLFGRAWFKTGYEITEKELIVKTGFTKAAIPIESISKLSQTYNPASAPALSFNRIEVLYNKGMGLALISPKDREAFVALLLEKNPAIHVDERLMGEEGES